MTLACYLIPFIAIHTYDPQYFHPEDGGSMVLQNIGILSRRP